MGRPALTGGLVATAVGSGLALAVAAHTLWNLRRLRTPSAAPPEPAEAVSVLIPARDEAERIGPVVRAALASRGVPDLELLVVDDCSTDATAAVVNEAAAGDPRARVLTGAPPPAGWLGKPWACEQAAAAARGSVLVFLDADVVLHEHGLAATVDALRRNGFDLVSPYPRQLADGPLPRLVQPLLQWSWLSLLPLGLAERSPRPSLAAANGQLLACDADAYRRVGGHGAVRGSVLDDVELLRVFKRNGFRGGVVDGTGVATCRMYGSGDELVAGYTKSLWAAFGPPAGAAAVVGGLLLAYLLPPLAAVVSTRPAVRAVGAAGYLAGVAGRVLVARRTGQRVLPDALAHPASIVVLSLLVARSWRVHATGTLRWRGRPIGVA